MGLLSSGLPRALTPRWSHSCVAGRALGGHLLESGLPCEPDLRASLQGPRLPPARGRGGWERDSLGLTLELGIFTVQGLTIHTPSA